MRTGLVLATVLAATVMALAGCGSDDSSSADQQEDTDQITAVISDVNQATRDKDALAACALMQPSGVAEVFNTQSQCVRETRKIFGQDAGEQPVLKIESISIDGDTATVELANDVGGAPVVLVKEGGKWYIPLSGAASTGTTGTTDG